MCMEEWSPGSQEKGKSSIKEAESKKVSTLYGSSQFSTFISMHCIHKNRHIEAKVTYPRFSVGGFKKSLQNQDPDGFKRNAEEEQH